MPLFVCLLLALGTLGGRASAQATGSDPTRPPLAFSQPASEAGAVTGPVLQSVKIPTKGRPFAVIGGQQVRLGDLYGDSRLISLTDREAVLEGPAGVERLLLTPGIEKTHLTTTTPATKRPQRGGKP